MHQSAQSGIVVDKQYVSHSETVPLRPGGAHVTRHPSFVDALRFHYGRGNSIRSERNATPGSARLDTLLQVEETSDTVFRRLAESELLASVEFVPERGRISARNFLRNFIFCRCAWANIAQCKQDAREAPIGHERASRMHGRIAENRAEELRAHEGVRE